MSFISGAITSWLYSAIFFAEASGYLRIVAPYALSAMLMALTVIPFVFYTGPMQLLECDKIDAEAVRALGHEERLIYSF